MMKVIARMTSSVYVQMQKFSRVPSFGAPLISCSSSYQVSLEAALSFSGKKLRKGLYTSFLYQTTKSQNIPLKRTKTQIWAKNPSNQNTWLILLPSQRSSLTCFSLLSSFETHKRFLHACTPERRTRACAHLFTQCTHGQTPHTTKHILQKNVQGAETLGNDSSGGASKPHRSKYIGSA